MVDHLGYQTTIRRLSLHRFFWGFVLVPAELYAVSVIWVEGNWLHHGLSYIFIPILYVVGLFIQALGVGGIAFCYFIDDEPGVVKGLLLGGGGSLLWNAFLFISYSICPYRSGCVGTFEFDIPATLFFFSFAALLDSLSHGALVQFSSLYAGYLFKVLFE